MSAFAKDKGRGRGWREAATEAMLQGTAKMGGGKDCPGTCTGCPSAPGTPVEVLHCTDKLPLQVSRGLLDSSPSRQGFPSSLQEWGLAGREASAQCSEIVSVDSCQCSAIGTL